MRKTLGVALLASVLAACGQKSAEEHYQLAQQALEQGGKETAVIELKNAIRMAPDNAQYRYLLGQVYFQQRNFTFAEKEFEKALENGFSSEQIIPKLSVIYRSLGNNDRLFKLTARAKGLQAQDMAKLKYYQLEAYVGQGNFDKAKASLEELKKIPDQGVYSQLGLAFQFIINNDLEAAIEQTKRSLQMFPDQQDALKLLGNLYQNNGQQDEALEVYKSYLALYSDDIEVKFRVARTLSGQDDFAAAEPLVDDLLTQYPNHPMLLQLKAAARLKAEDYSAASEFSERAILVEPEDGPLRLIAGISHYFLSEFEDSLQDLTLIATELPESHPALRMLVDVQVRLGLALDANDTLTKFSALTESEIGLAAGVGQALVSKGEFRKAREVLAQQETEIDSANVLANVARLKLSLNDVSGIADLEKAIEKFGVETDESPAENLEVVLGRAYLATGQFDKAQALASKWMSNEDSKEVGYLLQSQVYFAQQAPDKAKATLEEGVAALPQSVALIYALANSQNLQVESEKATSLTLLRRALDIAPDYVPAIVKWYLVARTSDSQQQVVSYLNQQLESRPETVSLALTLARIHVLEQRGAEAMVILNRFKQETSAVYRQVLAQALVQTGDIQNLKDLFSEWYQDTPNNVQAVVGMMRVYESRGEFDRALLVADKYLVEQGGNSALVKISRLSVMAKAGQYEDLAKELDELDKNLYQLPPVQGLRGQVALKASKFAAAEPLLLTAYKAQPTSLNAALLSQAYQGGKGLDFTRGFLKQHLDKHQDDQLNTLRLAQLVTGKNNAEAKDYYLKAIALDDGLFVAHNNVAHMFLMENDLDSAYKHAKRASELQPRQADVLDTLGYIEMQMGRDEAALQNLSMAMEVFGDRVPDDAFLNYLEALLKNGEKRLAQRRLDQHSFKGSPGSRLDDLKQQYQLQ